MELGKNVQQKNGIKAFIPNKFPPKGGFIFSTKIIQKANFATLKLGKLDGITQLLPDIDFFLFMYVRKDATSSNQIEGTKATMIDVLEVESHISDTFSSDVDDILHYIHALNYGIKRLNKFPLSLRLIREIHKELMRNARTSQFSDPGNFRNSQNWIGGTSIDKAHFVPPPPYEIHRVLSELEKFFYTEDDVLPIIKVGIIHAQFEMIHPFLDGNGRTGRLLISLLLCSFNLLELPILFLSWYFKKYQKLYYQRLDGYKDGEIEEWLEFFLDGVVETADEAIKMVKEITLLRERDMLKVHSLGKSSSVVAVKVLSQLFHVPIVNVGIIQKWTGFSRQGAYKVINRFIELNILFLKDENKKYGRSFVYQDYLNIFK